MIGGNIRDLVRAVTTIEMIQSYKPEKEDSILKEISNWKPLANTPRSRPKKVGGPSHMKFQKHENFGMEDANEE